MTIKAARLGDIESLRDLASKGIRLDKFDENGNSPIHVAALFGNADVVAFLVSNGVATDRRSKGRDGKTPAFIAATKGFDNVLSSLLENGANLKSRGKYNDSTLAHQAALHGHVNVLAFLANNKISIVEEDRHGHTPLHKVVCLLSISLYFFCNVIILIWII